jgi:hypothetical protein
MLRNGRGGSLSFRITNEIYLVTLSYITETLQLERESTRRQTAPLSFGPLFGTPMSVTHRPLPSPHQQTTHMPRSIRRSSSYGDSRPSSPAYGSYNSPTLHQQSRYSNDDTHTGHGVSFMLRSSEVGTTDKSYSLISRGVWGRK